ncbi:ArnT family glycosyltransferase [Rhizobium terrae]|uniref:ArnT family glycosyltransferase n=1 Tax=Rhizobium terrae TaxID=2171756 RepID=UPI0013C3745B|nr:glycosyltransferase family 39 protein [Rhizobium terrae]
MSLQNQSIGYETRFTAERHTLLLVTVFTYFLANFLIRMALPQGLELDEAEQAYFSQWLLAGYSSQPPLYNWLQHAAVQVFGLSLATLSSLKNVILLGSYLIYWMAARQVLRDRDLAIVATLGLLTIPQVAFEAQRDLSHTVATIFTASLFLYTLVRALRQPSVLAFAFLGLAAGLGVIAKYNFVLLPTAAFLAILSDGTWRQRLVDWRLAVAAGVALVVVSPHALWLADHFQATSSHTMNKLIGDDTLPIMAIFKGLGSLAVASLGFAGLTLAVFGLVYRERFRTVVAARNDWTRLTGRILLFSLCLIVLMILFVGVEKVRDRWLTPILLILPLYLATKIDAAKIDMQPGLRRIWGVALVIMAVVPSVLFGRVATAKLTGIYQYPNYPFVTLANEIRPLALSARTLIIASDSHLAGNIRLNLPTVPVMVTSTPTGIETLPVPGHDRLLFVWRNAHGSMPSGFPPQFAQYLEKRGLAGSVPQPVVTALPYNYGQAEDRYRFAYATVEVGRQGI